MSLNWNKLYTYPKTVRSNIDGTRRYEIDDEKLPSVTTIISGTQDASKTESLDRWKLRVGEVEAERIRSTAAARGTAMHTFLEHHIKGGNVLDLTDVGREASSMAKTILIKVFLTCKRYGVLNALCIILDCMPVRPICVEFIRGVKA